MRPSYAEEDRKAREASTAFVAFLVAPLPLPVFVAGIDLLATGGAGVTSLTPLIYGCSLLAGGVVGLPLYSLGKRFGLIRWWSATIAGAAVGFVGVLMFLGRWANFPVPYTLFEFAGACSGFVFWLVWRRGTRQKAG